MPDPSLDRFLETLQASLRDSTFVKLTLSEPGASAGELRNVYGRLVEIKGGKQLSLVFHHARKDVTKNFLPADAAPEIARLLSGELGRAYLFTTSGDWQWRPGVLKASRPRFTVAPAPEHDRKKVAPIESRSGFLQALGVTNAAGDPRPGMADKLRQIQRFTELLGHLLDASSLKQKTALRVLDMGSGKGYLTFAAHELLRLRGFHPEVIGVEQREDLVQLTEGVARELRHDGLSFVPGTIADFQPAEEIDVLIALHACNTATDDALFRGIQARAALLLVAPCCHQELRAQLQPPPVLREVLRHGILAEREAELVTDGIRALLLEIHGYKASVFEFISPEHTGKNLMLAAHRRIQPIDPEPLRQRLSELLDFYGIREQRLARLLGER
ncbi:MAG TPA: SAM-dependent methyltransferase [Chthoniobacteraceae bacterium]|jgi:SAM-dependent methyltransferase